MDKSIQVKRCVNIFGNFEEMLVASIDYLVRAVMPHWFVFMFLEWRQLLCVIRNQINWPASSVRAAAAAAHANHNYCDHIVLNLFNLIICSGTSVSVLFSFPLIALISFFHSFCFYFSILLSFARFIPTLGIAAKMKLNFLLQVPSFAISYGTLKREKKNRPCLTINCMACADWSTNCWIIY